jgi:hypothetical protein
VVATGTGFLLLTLLLHIFINALKNLQGKCCIGFVAAVTIAWVSTLLIGEVAAKVALIFAFAWITVLIFDVWWVLM